MQESKVTPTCSVSILVSTIVVRDCGHTNFSGHKVKAKGVYGKVATLWRVWDKAGSVGLVFHKQFGFQSVRTCVPSG